MSVDMGGGGEILFVDILPLFMFHTLISFAYYFPLKYFHSQIVFL